MLWRQRLARAGLFLSFGAVFILWHLPLLTPEGRIRGWHSDAAILALMAKKMVDGRGFDIFFWGQNYLGPLSPMFVAGWGLILGTVDSLALRLGAFTQIFLGCCLAWATVARIDRRAATAMLIGLAITPPVLLRMLIVPLTGETAFLLSSAILLVVMLHVTAPEGRGVLTRPFGQFAFGFLAGVSWWMNQQVVFALGAAAIVLILRSDVGRWIRHIPARVDATQRPVPGLLAAFVWVSTCLGGLLLVVFVVCDVAGLPRPPFVFGRVVDPLILIAVPVLLLAIFRGPLRLSDLRSSRVGTRQEQRAVVVFAIGAAIGYLPVWLGGLLGWYERAYGISFAPNYPGEAFAQARELAATLPHWIGMRPDPIGVAFGVAVVCLAIFAVAHVRSNGRLLLALVLLLNVFYFIVAHAATKPHYLVTSVAPLFALAALGAFDLWDSRRRFSRAAVLSAGAVAFVSMTSVAAGMHREVTTAPDPMPLLARVEAAGCHVVYADFWIAYRYRFLDQERRAWIPWRSLNRTRAESLEMQKLPGRRCLVRNDGSVVPLKGDLPLRFSPPRAK